MIIHGERVFLRPIQPTDFPHLVAWTNDPEISRLMDGDYPATLEACADWHRAELSNRHSQRFALCMADDEKLIGDVALDHIAWRSGDAELRIRIGEKSYWDKGYGQDAVGTLLDHAFSKMNLSRIYLRVFAFNKRAIRCYEKCGFRKEGRLRREGPDGVPTWVFLMRIRKEERTPSHSGASATTDVRPQTA